MTTKLETPNAQPSRRDFLATTAARRGYTQTSFAELLAQIQALPGSMNPYGVLFAQVASNLPLLDEEPDPVGELLIE